MNESLGSAAHEAVRLLGAAQEWAQERLGDQHLATGSAECTACPVCQAVGALRHVTPESIEQVVDAAGSFLAAVKAAFGAPPEGRGHQHDVPAS